MDKSVKCCQFCTKPLSVEYFAVYFPFKAVLPSVHLGWTFSCDSSNNWAYKKKMIICAYLSKRVKFTTVAFLPSHYVCWQSEKTSVQYRLE